ncbi:MAG: hypothetical protein RL754_96 [Bacteroidota bacterium]|jgi:8-oxo-dGTP pyrophosphatase MutT (NUDIX family)
MVQNYAKVFISASVLIPIPGIEAPEFINSLSTVKRVKNWLLDRYELKDALEVRIGIDHPFWDLFLTLHKHIIAGGGWVKNPEGKLLIIERKGKLDMPKGKLEKNEPIDLCAIREVEEECQLPGCTIVGPAVKTYHCYKENGGMILKTTYWYPMSHPGKDDLKPQKEEGISDVYWASPKKLAKRKKKMPCYNSIEAAFKRFIEEGRLY